MRHVLTSINRSARMYCGAVEATPRPERAGRQPAPPPNSTRLVADEEPDDRAREPRKVVAAIVEIAHERAVEAPARDDLGERLERADDRQRAVVDGS